MVENKTSNWKKLLYRRGVKPAQRRLSRATPEELLILVALLTVVVALWGFVELADEVIEGETRDVDTRVVRMFRSAADPATPIGPPWLAQAARDITALGGHTLLTLFTVLTAGFCMLIRRYGTLLLIVIAAAGGSTLSYLLKATFERPRPEVVPHLMEAAFSSFPSGHAMASAAVYLALAAILAQIIPSRWGKFYALGVALLLTGLVGVSRVFLGVHYPSDVLAGWAVGLAWSLLCWAVSRALYRRRIVRDQDG